VVCYTDPLLTTGESYYYRSYLTNFQTVSSSTPAKSLTTGSEIFKYNDINPDGEADDWNAIEPIQSSFDDNTYVFRIFADTKNLNFLITGNLITGFELYVETDDDPMTGAIIPGWNTEGVDYRIKQDSLFNFQQVWQYTGRLGEYVFSDSLIEFSVPSNDVSIGDETIIRSGLIVYCGSDTLYLPFRKQSLDVYSRIIPTGPPVNFHLASSQADPTSRLIIRWDKCTNCDGNVIEKSEESSGSFEFLVELDQKAYQYIDDSLENHTEYSYRMYNYNPAGRSDYTRTVTASTHDVGITDRDTGDRFQVFTDPSYQRIVVRINDPDLAIETIALYDFSGRQVYSSKTNKGEQEFSISIQGLNSGIYLLYLNYQNGQYSEKILIY